MPDLNHHSGFEPKSSTGNWAVSSKRGAATHAPSESPIIEGRDYSKASLICAHATK